MRDGVYGGLHTGPVHTGPVHTTMQPAPCTPRADPMVWAYARVRHVSRVSRQEADRRQTGIRPEADRKQTGSRPEADGKQRWIRSASGRETLEVHKGSVERSKADHLLRDLVHRGRHVHRVVAHRERGQVDAGAPVPVGAAVVPLEVVTALRACSLAGAMGGR